MNETNRPSPSRLKAAARIVSVETKESVDIDVPDAIMREIRNTGYLSQLLMVSIALNMQESDDQQGRRDFKIALEDAVSTHETLRNIGAG